MTVLDINGTRVQVDDGFKSLSAEDQQKAVEEIWQQLQSGPTPAPSSETQPSQSTKTQSEPTQIPEGMVFDPKTGGYVDTALAAERMGPMQGAIANTLSAIPFVGTYTDEAIGKLDGPIAQETFRQARDQYQEDNPVGAGVAQVAGAIGGALPIAAAAGPALAARAGGTLGAKMVQGAGIGTAAGAAEGAVAGFGEGDTLDDRKTNAAERSAFGGAAGGALGFVAPALATGVRSFLTRLKGSDQKAIQTAFGVSPAAARVVRQALDVDDLDTAIEALNRAGDDAMLADAGQAGRELLDAAANSGGQAGAIARRAVDERTASASANVTAELDSVFGPPAGREGLVREIASSTKEARAQAYEAAYGTPIDYASRGGQRLQDLLQRVPQSAINDANRLMQLEGVESAQILARLADDGSATFETLPDVRQIHLILQALDGTASKLDGQGALGGTTPLGRATKQLRRRLADALKREVPEFAQAQDIAADSIKRVQASEFGGKLLRAQTTREQVSEALEGASRDERIAMAQGVRSYVDDTMARVMRTATDPNVDVREGARVIRDLSSRASRDKLRILLGKDRAERLFETIDEQATAFELRAAIAVNSKTAVRQSIREGVQQQTAPGVLESLTSGDPLHASRRFVQLFTGNSSEAQALREAGIFEQIAEALTSIRGKDAERALRLVKRAMDGQQISERGAAYIGQTLATSGQISSTSQASQALQ